MKESGRNLSKGKPAQRKGSPKNRKVPQKPTTGNQQDMEKWTAECLAFKLESNSAGPLVVEPHRGPLDDYKINPELKRPKDLHGPALQQLALEGWITQKVAEKRLTDAVNRVNKILKARKKLAAKAMPTAPQLSEVDVKMGGHNLLGMVSVSLDGIYDASERTDRIEMLCFDSGVTGTISVTLKVLKSNVGLRKLVGKTVGIQILVESDFHPSCTPFVTYAFPPTRVEDNVNRSDPSESSIRFAREFPLKVSPKVVQYFQKSSLTVEMWGNPAALKDIIAEVPSPLSFRTDENVPARENIPPVSVPTFAKSDGQEWNELNKHFKEALQSPIDSQVT